MKNKKYILLFAKLISYIKAKEQNPSQDEMDKVWNNILINIKKTDDKVEPCLKNIFENLIFKVLGAAAVVTVLIFSFNIYVDYPQNNSLKSYENILSIVNQKVDSICIITDEKKLTNIISNTTIDYSKSKKQVKIGKQNIDKPKGTMLHQLIVPKGKHTRLILSDGSELFVNASTKVIFPSEFDKDHREIYVDGEVFIDVVPNKYSPFIVRTVSCDVEVLGTTFNIQSYSNENRSEVVLVKGLVKIKDKFNKEMKLTPNDLAVISDNKILGKQKVNASDYILWTKGLIKLNATPFSCILKRLEKYYGVKFVYSENVGKMKFYGLLDLDCSIDELLRRLEFTAPIKYRKINGIFEINEN